MYLSQHSFVEQTLFLGSHHKVVGLILVVYHIFQVNACGHLEPVEHLCIKDVEESANLIHLGLLFSALVN